MFIISLNYIAPVEEIDKAMQEHREFLDRYFKQGIFICAGRKNPRTGGMIICLAESREQVNTIIQEDPFFSLNLALYDICDVQVTRCSQEFKAAISKN